MKEYKNFEFSNSHNEILRGKLFLPESNGIKPPVVFMMTGDGKKGSNGLSWINLPKLFLEKGIASFVFDFSGLGTSEGKRKDLNLSKAISDSQIAFNFLLKLEEVDVANVGIFAASFGGNVAILSFSKNENIKAMALKSPVSFYPDSFMEEFGLDKVLKWKKVRYLEEIGFNYEFYIDSLKHNSYELATNISFPCLIVHGDNDEIVPVNQSRHLFNALINSPTPVLKIKKGVDHRYSLPGAWDEMALDSVLFLTDELTR